MSEHSASLNALDNGMMFERISSNPWDTEVVEHLVKQATAEKFRVPSTHESGPNFYDSFDAHGLIDFMEHMRGAASLEAKYQLLAENATYDDAYVKWFQKKYSHDPEPQTWYDVIQGRPYTALAESDTPFSIDETDSVVSAMSNLIGSSQWWRAIDLGSGTGNMNQVLKKSAEHIVSVDSNGFLHKIAQLPPNGLPNADQVVADASRILPIKKEGADLVVSNGLTAFIPKDKLDDFSGEIERVLEEGGSYIESAILPRLGNTLNKEYIQNAKGLLAYMVGELVTSSGPGESGAYPHTLRETDAVYKKAGLTLITHQYSDDVIILEYFKVPVALNDALYEHIYNGDGVSAKEDVSKYLSSSDDDLGKRIRVVGRMAQLYQDPLTKIPGRRGYFDAEIFVETFIQPLADIVERPDLGEKELKELHNVYSSNLLVIRRFMDVVSQENPYVPKAFEALAQAHKKIIGDPRMEPVHYLSEMTLPRELR